MTLQKRMPKLDVKMNPFKDNEDERRLVQIVHSKGQKSWSTCRKQCRR